MTVNEIREEILPEIDDELAKRRYDTLDALKQEITANLRQGYDKRVEQELNEQAFAAWRARASRSRRPWSRRNSTASSRRPSGPSLIATPRSRIWG